MSNTLKLAMLAFLVLALAYALGFFASGGNWVIYRVWEPKMENARRQVFENTQSYIQGKTQYISTLQYEYVTTKDGDRRAALRGLILAEASTVAMSKLPPSLQQFILSLGRNQ